MAFRQLTPGTLLAPVPPTLVTAGRETNDKIEQNVLTVAWAGTVCSDPPMISISVRPERYSHALIKDSGEFVVNLTSSDMLRAADLCGVKSGRDTDKFALTHLTPVPVDGMRFAPAIAQAPMYFACHVEQTLSLGSHDMFVGRIVKMGVREDLLDGRGRIDLGKANLVAYNHGAYYALGDALGFFGYSVAAPDVLARRMNELNPSSSPHP